MQNVKVGVIGVGVLGRHHARLYTQCPSADLIGVYDCDRARAAQIAEEFGTRAFDSVEELVGEIEAASVAVPTDRHFDVVSQLFDRGRHALVEKPLAGTVPEARELVEKAARTNLALGVGHVERFNPVLACLNGVSGEPRFIEAQRLASYPPPRPGLHPRGTEVSVVLDLMIHDLDVILDLVQSPVTAVDAVGVSILSPTEDIASAHLQFENGCVANVTASRVSQEQLRKIRLFKSNAYLSLDYGRHTGEMAWLEEGGIRREPVPVHESNALQDELDDFCRSVLARRGGEEASAAEPRVSGLAALKALELADRILNKIHARAQK